MTYSYEEALEASVNYFDGDELAANAFVTKYALEDPEGNLKERTPDDMHKRLSKEFARIEKSHKNPMSEEEIYKLLANYKYIVPQGSPMSGIGNTYQYQSLSNCFVISSPEDSYGGVMKADQEQVQLMKRRGGVGFDLSTLRNSGLRTSNAARTTGGVGIFMDRFSNSCREVAQDGRRGALMLTLSVHHPDILTFINKKRDTTKVTGANVSVRFTDEFMVAVGNDTTYELRFPVDPAKERIYSRQIRAKEVWDEVIDAAWSCAEPGALFWDTVLRWTPANIYADEGFLTVSTNPCSEITLSANDSCRLMLLNLVSFVVDAFTPNAYFDFELFKKYSGKALRLLDDLVDLEIESIDRILLKVKSDPEGADTKSIEVNLWKKIRLAAQMGRRTGLGITGLGDTLAMLGLKYGGKESCLATEDIYKCLAVGAYRESCTLAKERGAFPVYSYSKEVSHPFMKRLFEADPGLRRLHRNYGRRNIAILTTAPCGTVSTQTQTTSGIEPAFMLEYTRRKKINPNDKGARVDFVDPLGDKWQEYRVYHHKFKEWMSTTGLHSVKDSPYYLATANEIDWASAVDLQACAQKWVCHAISKTINLPNDVSREDVEKVYWRAWEKGLKGLTVYRDGCRTGVLVSGEGTERGIGFATHDAPTRPDELLCSIHSIKVKGDNWSVLVGLLDGRPYEILGGKRSSIELPRQCSEGKIVKTRYKTKPSRYDLVIWVDGKEVVVRDVVSVFDSPNHAGFTRTISLALRHGAPIHYLVEQLQKDKEMDMFSFSKGIARVLKKYINNGTKASDKVCPNCSVEDALIYQEGCVTCTSCGFSKCS
jgi:ribonucleoside-diphosphate reductase alpha chain